MERDLPGNETPGIYSKIALVQAALLVTTDSFVKVAKREASMSLISRRYYVFHLTVTLGSEKSHLRCARRRALEASNSLHKKSLACFTTVLLLRLGQQRLPTFF